MTKEEIISALKECAARLGHTPTHTEFRTHAGVNMRSVKKHFPSYTSALAEAGLERSGGGARLTMPALFKEWAQVARKLKKIPTIAEFELDARYTSVPYVSRFMSWRHVPGGLHRFAEKEGLAEEYADVLAIIREYHGLTEDWGYPSLASPIGKPPGIASATAPADPPAIAPAMTPTIESTMTPTTATSSAPMSEALSGRKPALKPGIRPIMRRPILLDRPVYGAPMAPMALGNVPVNEMGVVFLFGMLARELGFSITRIQREFPDCEALRQMDADRWQRLWIEFEFESRNFLEHQHDPEKCDLIVCWSHNWPECPIEVLELKSVMQEMSLVLPR